MFPPTERRVYPWQPICTFGKVEISMYEHFPIDSVDAGEAVEQVPLA
jgi:hypothetical protein